MFRQVEVYFPNSTLNYFLKISILIQIKKKIAVHMQFVLVPKIPLLNIKYKDGSYLFRYFE